MPPTDASMPSETTLEEEGYLRPLISGLRPLSTQPAARPGSPGGKLGCKKARVRPGPGYKVYPGPSSTCSCGMLWGRVCPSPGDTRDSGTPGTWAYPGGSCARDPGVPELHSKARPVARPHATPRFRQWPGPMVPASSRQLPAQRPNQRKQAAQTQTFRTFSFDMGLGGASISVYIKDKVLR